jgi:spore coat protein U-like protein
MRSKQLYCWARLFAAMSSMVAGQNMAWGAQASSNLPVRFKLIPACSITLGSAMDFGSFNAEDLAAGRSAEGSVKVNCGNGTPWFVSVNTGLNPDGTGLRRMRSGVATSSAYTMPYKIYTSAAATAGTEFPTSTGTPGAGASGGTGNGGDQTLKLYGRIAPYTGTLPKADLYSDTIVVTLNW